MISQLRLEKEGGGAAPAPRPHGRARARAWARRREKWRKSGSRPPWPGASCPYLILGEGGGGWTSQWGELACFLAQPILGWPRLALSEC
eukprot:scaffold5391_cov121-Isochrysis_galbana.AAC.6